MATKRAPKVEKLKTPTLKEKVEVYEQLLHDLQFHTTVTMRPEMVRHLLGKIEAWSYAHRAGNGELSEAQQQERINHAFHKLAER